MVIWLQGRLDQFNKMFFMMSGKFGMMNGHLIVLKAFHLLYVERITEYLAYDDKSSHQYHFNVIEVRVIVED